MLLKLPIGKRVKVLHQSSAHFPKVGDIGVVVGYLNEGNIIVFDRPLSVRATSLHQGVLDEEGNKVDMSYFINSNKGIVSYLIRKDHNDLLEILPDKIKISVKIPKNEKNI